MSRSGASFKRGKSKQDYSTPTDFLQAVEKCFQVSFDWDLAAHAGNAVCKSYLSEDVDSLSIPWHQLRGALWLNPPFGNIKSWAEKCLAEGAQGADIFFLVPASVGAAWFLDNILGRAQILFLRGRLSFDGNNPFPKDCMLCRFGPEAEVGVEEFNWRGWAEV